MSEKQEPSQSLVKSPSLPAELLQPGQQKSEQSLEPAAEDPLAWLDQAERYAYDYFNNKMRAGSSDTFPIAVGIAEQMMQLYLQGRTLTEIRRLNPTFQLGQIVHAAVEGRWNLQREAYIALTVARAKSRAVVAAAEGIELAADMMASMKKLHGDNAARFLQTGNPKDLGSATALTTIKQLREVAEVLMKLTGQEQKKQVGGVVEVKHSGSVSSIPMQPMNVEPSDAAKILAGWAAAEKKRQSEERD